MIKIVILYIIFNNMNNALNRVKNTVAIPVRMWGTAVVTSADLFTTLNTYFKDSYELIANTSQEVKNVLLWAWNHGKRYHKALNIPLSPIIATWTAIEWIVRSAVQPAISWIINAWNTGINTIKNARKGSFGRIFSKRPLSDFSYNHIKTKPVTLNNWFAKAQFARGKSEWTNVAIPVPVKTKEKKDENKKEEKDSNKEKKDKDNKNTKEEEKNNDWTKNENNKGSEEKKDSKKEKKNEDNKNTKEEEKNNDWTKNENNKENKEKEKWYTQAEELLKDTKYWKTIYDKRRKSLPELIFIFDDSSSTWEIKGNENKVIVWTKIPSDEKQIAPLNNKKDAKEQSRHVLLHELWHIVIHNNLSNKKVEKAIKLSKNIFEKDKKTISPLAQLSVYKNSESKANEDLTEMLALYANKPENLDQYLSKLTSDKKEDEEYRDKFKLAKISNDDVNTIKDAVKELVDK